MAPGTTTARFTATFRVTVTYQAKTSATATPVAGSITFTSRSGTSTPITATVEKLTNALRVLVVPMGNASQPFASQYTAPVMPRSRRRCSRCRASIPCLRASAR